MIQRDLDELWPPRSDDEPCELQRARALAQFVDRLAAGQVERLSEFIAQSPHLAPEIALELETLEELGAIIEASARGQVPPGEP